MLPSLARRPPLPRSRVAVAVALIALACPALARALSIGEITPLYFDGAVRASRRVR